MKIAFVHDWLNGMRGGEKCLEALTEDHPQSPIYTLFCEKDKISNLLSSHPIRTSFIEKLPGHQKHYRNYLPLFPAAIGAFRGEEADLVLSTSHCVAKSFKKPMNSKHLCYCFTPMRYAWTMFDEYFSKQSPLKRFFIGGVMGWLRRWDYHTAQKVDHFVAISQHIRKRIESCYGRTAEVVYPPVDTLFFTPDPAVQREDFYLVVSALVPYKRVDLAIQVMMDLGKTLVVIGDGPESESLKKMAGPKIRFLGWQPDEVLREYYRKAKALLFPGEEDFGIVPVEAQACGCPVLALGKGGALETVLPEKTGLFFDALEVSSLKKCIQNFEKMNMDSNICVANAARFSKSRFKSEMNAVIRRLVNSE